MPENKLPLLEINDCCEYDSGFSICVLCHKLYDRIPDENCPDCVWYGSLVSLTVALHAGLVKCMTNHNAQPPTSE